MATMKTLNGYGFNATELDGKAPEYYIQPRNLLDNSDFRNPVNQRGVTNTSTVGYCIDRWFFGLSGSGALSVQDGLLAFNASDGSYCQISQIQENSSALSEKEMTFAVCIAPDNIMCLNFTYGTGASVLSADGNISLIHYDGNRLYIRFISTGNNWIGVKWAALYEGTYTADTLPPYVPKGYAAELAECQRRLIPVRGRFTCVAFSSKAMLCNIFSNIPLVGDRNPGLITTRIAVDIVGVGTQGVSLTLPGAGYGNAHSIEMETDNEVLTPKSAYTVDIPSGVFIEEEL